MGCAVFDDVGKRQRDDLLTHDAIRLVSPIHALLYAAVTASIALMYDITFLFQLLVFLNMFYFANYIF